MKLHWGLHVVLIVFKHNTSHSIQSLSSEVILYLYTTVKKIKEVNATNIELSHIYTGARQVYDKLHPDQSIALILIHGGSSGIATWSMDVVATKLGT